ncbi:MAG: type II secretion system protein [Candidatus Borkfalkiaceae bacterium]|nr:type II secretion system protein [Christensenellaceae bacterium]
MKKKLKKGFTLVELVIVIAVIAILSAVLIPTFGNVIGKAKESAAKSEVSNTITQYTTNQASNELPSDLPKEGYIILFKSEQTVAQKSGTVNYDDSYKKDNISYVFSYNNGKLETVEVKTAVIKTITSGTPAVSVNVLELTIGKENTTVNLKIDGLTVNDDNTWTAKGTVVLDGKVVESTGENNTTIKTLKGKVVLLTVVA